MPSHSLAGEVFRRTPKDFHYVRRRQDGFGVFDTILIRRDMRVTSLAASTLKAN